MTTCSKKEINGRKCSLFEVTIKPVIRWDKRKTQHNTTQHNTTQKTPIRTEVQAQITTVKTKTKVTVRAAVFQVHVDDISYLFDGHSTSVQVLYFHP